MTRQKAELNQLRAFALQIAEHLYLAAEVLSIRAERRKTLLYKGDQYASSHYQFTIQQEPCTTCTTSTCT